MLGELADEMTELVADEMLEMTGLVMMVVGWIFALSPWPILAPSLFLVPFLNGE